MSAGGGVVLSDVREGHPAGWLSAWRGGDECACLECDGGGGDDEVGGGCCFGDWERWMLGVEEWRRSVGVLVVGLESVCPEDCRMDWRLLRSKVVAGVKEEWKKFAQCQGGLLVLRVLWRLAIGGQGWPRLEVMLVLQQGKGQEEMKWRLQRSGLVALGLVEHDPVERLAGKPKMVARLPGCSPIALVPAGRLVVELVAHEVPVVGVVVVVGKSWQEVVMARVPAEAVSRKMESCGDVVSEVRAVLVVESVGVVDAAMLAAAYEVVSVCVESWEVCEAVSVGWEMCGLL